MSGPNPPGRDSGSSGHPGEEPGSVADNATQNVSGASGDNPDTGQTDFYSRAYSAPESEQFVSSAYAASSDIVPYDYDSYDAGNASELPPPPRWPWVVGVLAVLLAALLGLGAWYAGSLGRTFDDHRQTVDVGALEQAAGNGPLNVLVLGSDSREGEGEQDMGQRSDTMMLVHIPADRRQVYVMSVLRDSWVTVPGHGEAKINSAFDTGGYALAVDTVELLLGVPIHHVLEVDFQGFRGVTNALGGVEVCNPQAFSSGQANPSYYPRGHILLQDTAALRYVRERHAFDDGDVTRVKNQQRYLAGAMDRFLSPQILGNPARTTEVVATFSDHLGVDEGLTSGVIASLAWQLRDVRGEDVEMFTVPRKGFAEGPNGDAIVELDEDKLADLRSALADDDVQRYVDEHEPKKEKKAQAAGGPAPVLTLLTGTTPAPALGEDPCDD